MLAARDYNYFLSEISPLELYLVQTEQISRNNVEVSLRNNAEVSLRNHMHHCLSYLRFSTPLYPSFRLQCSPSSAFGGTATESVASLLGGLAAP